ncbi:MAG: DNA translocase FtsK 4TM domain-containing protein, partial [Flavipsychrobacter sp.]
MADTKKKTKKTSPPKVAAVAPITVDRNRQVRLGLGIIFLLLGVFTCFAIVSYFFSWQVDQDKVFGAGMGQFIFHDHTPVANWGGRLGAALSHLLVYKGVGVAALAIGLWITSIGLTLIYGKRLIVALRYMRWLSILLLIAAPVMAYVRPHSAFPYGGAWGNEAIEYLNGFAGQMGAGLVLLAVVCFFVFVVFALDIRPFLKRMKRKAATVAAAITPTPAIAEETPVTEPVKAPIAAIADEPPAKDWNMTMNERQAKTVNDIYAAPKSATEPIAEQEVIEEEPEDEDYYEEDEEIIEEPENEITLPVTPAKAQEADKELSFEVITQTEEKPAAIKHGDHISIESSEPYAPELDLPDYKFPTLNLLDDRATEAISLDKEELEKNKNQIIQTLRSFGIEIQRISATVGPTVTLYEIVPAEGVRISKIRNLEDDIALNLAALGIRIIAPIPGRGTIGIEVPNAHKQLVPMRALISSDKFVNNKMSLPIALGKKIDNENYIVDLATMPHLLMAGATGQGKSVGINAILVSLLYKKHPSQLKFVMVDPKKVELSIYRTIEKHFLAKLPNEEEAIITDTK